jgi:hypothetical protein
MICRGPFSILISVLQVTVDAIALDCYSKVELLSFGPSTIEWSYSRVVVLCTYGEYLLRYARVPSSNLGGTNWFYSAIFL